MSLGIFAPWVVQVGRAYSTRSKFAGLLSAMYRYFAYVCLKLKDLLILVQILERQLLFLRLTMDISFSSAEYLEIQDYLVMVKCLKGQIGATVGVAQNSAC